MKYLEGKFLDIYVYIYIYRFRNVALLKRDSSTNE